MEYEKQNDLFYTKLWLWYSKNWSFFRDELGFDIHFELSCFTNHTVFSGPELEPFEQSIVDEIEAQVMIKRISPWVNHGST